MTNEIDTIVDMQWSLKSDRTDAKDGEYRFRTTMFDYNNVNEDRTFLVWTTHYLVTVHNGRFNKAEALLAAGHLMHNCGYWGRYLEDIIYDPLSETFDISVGS